LNAQLGKNPGFLIFNSVLAISFDFG